MDMASLNNLLSFLEAVFNGGSDFNEPIKRCLDRMAEAEWANSDILLVSDGELRQPGPEVLIMAASCMASYLDTAAKTRFESASKTCPLAVAVPLHPILIGVRHACLQFWHRPAVPLLHRSCGSCQERRTSSACACTASSWGRLRRGARIPPC